MKKIIYLSMFSLLLFLAAGCTKKENTATDESTPAVTENRTDTGITTEVKVKITDDELLDGTDISVDTENGVVTLTGTVANDAQKERAKELVSNTEGVKDVRNELQIGESKSATLEDEKEKVEGYAEDAVDKTKDAAEKTAEETKELADKTGDKTKDLAQKTGLKINDATITSEIKLKLAGDDLTDALDIDVDTKNGVVTLTGKVSSQAEADRAVQLARSVEDVKDVNSNLKIQADR
jgi:hyperosmotically inducible periplasmic protein